MCLICVEFQKGKMTIDEGWKNLSEMRETIEEEHITEVEEMLWDAWALQENKEAILNHPEADVDHWYWEHGHGD